MYSARGSLSVVGNAEENAIGSVMTLSGVIVNGELAVPTLGFSSTYPDMLNPIRFTSYIIVPTPTPPPGTMLGPPATTIGRTKAEKVMTRPVLIAFAKSGTVGPSIPALAKDSTSIGVAGGGLN
jgi:hypothetical protein